MRAARVIQPGVRVGFGAVLATAFLVAMSGSAKGAVTGTYGYDPDFDSYVLVANSDDASDTIRFGCAGGNVALNGTPIMPGGQPVPCGEPNVIDIHGNGGSDTVDNQGISRAAGFTSIYLGGEDEPDSVMVDLGAGEDTATGGAFGEEFNTADFNTGADVIGANGGNDEIYGSNGGDRIQAGTGQDSIYPVGGNDVVYAGAQDDYIEEAAAQRDRDRLFGGGGRDSIAGGGRADLIGGGPGGDFLEGMGGRDRILGRGGSDGLFGGGGADALFGHAGPDYIRGGPGPDLIRPGPGKDDVRQ